MVTTTVRETAGVALWDAGCVDGPDHEHTPHVLGYRPDGFRTDGLDCHKPLAVRCRVCRADTSWQCRNHRRSKCPPCSGRYGRKVRRVAHEGMRSRDRDRAGVLGMLTLTGPGERAGHLRFIPGKGGPHRPVCGCENLTAGPGGLGAWNATAAKRWNRLRTALRQRYPGATFFRAVETQKRGALHLHVLLWTPDGIDLLEVHRLALLAGFGCAIDWEEATTGSPKKFAHYVSKYVTKSTDTREECPWTVDEIDTETGEVLAKNVPARYRTWSMSRDWGPTMKMVAAVIAAGARRRALALREASSAGEGCEEAPAASAGAPAAPDPP